MVLARSVAKKASFVSIAVRWYLFDGKCRRVRLQPLRAERSRRLSVEDWTLLSDR